MNIYDILIDVTYLTTFPTPIDMGGTALEAAIVHLDVPLPALNSIEVYCAPTLYHETVRSLSYVFAYYVGTIGGVSSRVHIIENAPREYYLIKAGSKALHCFGV